MPCLCEAIVGYALWAHCKAWALTTGGATCEFEPYVSHQACIELQALSRSEYDTVHTIMRALLCSGSHSMRLKLLCYPLSGTASAPMQCNKLCNGLCVRRMCACEDLSAQGAVPTFICYSRQTISHVVYIASWLLRSPSH